MVDRIRKTPGLAQFEDIIRDFPKKYMSYDSIKGELVSSYASEFTEQELRDLTKFYQSPLGQKLAEKQPVLPARSALIGQRQVQAHLPELQAAIRERVAKQTQGQGPGESGGGAGGGGGEGTPRQNTPGTGG